jgi:hypothetical protein
VLTLATICDINNPMRKMPEFVGEPEGHAVREVVRVLNSPAEWSRPAAREHLTKLIGEWQRARTSPGKFEGAPLAALLKMKLPPGSPNLIEIQKNLRVTLSPAGSGAFYSIHYSPGRTFTDWDHAWDYFRRLITDPEREQFGGPCDREGCDRYFIAAGAKPKRYCSPECASWMGARLATKHTRQQKQTDKLALAREAISRYNPRRTQDDWKTWVAKYCRALDVTPKWLTRAVNAGQLEPPKE